VGYKRKVGGIVAKGKWVHFGGECPSRTGCSFDANQGGGM